MKDFNFTGYFTTPIYTSYIPEWVDKYNKLSNKYITQSKKMFGKEIKKRNKDLKKDIGDFGVSYHSTSLINDKDFEQLKVYVTNSARKILDHMGYDLTNYYIKWNEMWVQEFGKRGGGHHEGHIHYNQHISGFYFLKCSDRTSKPVFHDPRIAKLMSDLPQKKEENITFSSSKVNIRPKPGTLILFPAFLEHEFLIDLGIDPFRFIHFNLQAVQNDA